jgi:hypothetical protein
MSPSSMERQSSLPVSMVHHMFLWITAQAIKEGSSLVHQANVMMQAAWLTTCLVRCHLLTALHEEIGNYRSSCLLLF